MPKKSPITVLLSLDDGALAKYARAALAETRPVLEVHNAARAEAAGVGSRSIDVIVIASGDTPRLAPQLARRVARGEAAILAIGSHRFARDRETATESTAEPVLSGPDIVGPEASAVLPADATPRELVLVCRLLAENVHLRRRLRSVRRHRGRLARLAESDPLTGLANRRAWQRELHARLRDAGQKVAEQCLAIVDLDRFKRVNDARGYAAGDRLLATAAAALRQAVRSGDFVARLGGDEFGLLLSGVDRRAAAAIIERLCARVGADPLLAADAITASAGYVVFTVGGGLDGAAIMAEADRALREAKSQGRNRACAAAVALP